MVTKEYSTLELLELGRSFKQGMKDSLAAWLVRLCDLGADGISLSAAKAEELSNILTHPSLRHMLHSLRHSEGNQRWIEGLTRHE